MKIKFLSLLLAFAMALSAVGCAGGAEDAPEPAPEPAPAAEPQRIEASNGDDGETPSGRGLSMTVDSATGKLSIKRAALSGGGTGESGVWTIFVYLCGTDLETKFESATGDLQEMTNGASGDAVRFVVQTGGTKEWHNEVVSSDKLQRFLIQDGGIQLMDEQPLADMGSGDTLSGFLRWGLENYASEQMGLIFWNHGGGSITGVCFDELHNKNSLDLKEIDAALYETCSAAGRRFDFIGFDACLMGTVEAANVAASYADYMVASEESEPGSGWDYTVIGSYIVKNRGTDMTKLGPVICDSFYESCSKTNEEGDCTLSVIDLGRMNDLLVAFNDFAHEMFTASEDETKRAAMVREITKAENFGCNNKSEGYTNMVDMGGLAAACAGSAGSASAVLAALKNAVVYAKNGSQHKTATGLAMYYPLCIQGSEELSFFGSVCPSPYYISFVDRLKQGGVVDDISDYDSEQWFDESGEWNWGEESDDGHWDYAEGQSQSGASQHITFATAPHVDEQGSYWFELDEAGNNAAADVYGMAYQLTADGKEIIELGETYDVQGDWNTGKFADNFDGWWISLPDGQNLATYVVGYDGDCAIYTSPIQLNGEETNLRVKLDYNAGTITIEGAWAGVDESGAAAREVTKLKSGDVITPLYYAYLLEDYSELSYIGSDYTFTGEPELNYGAMEDGSYLYAFCIDDIYGDYYLSDFISFTVKDGEVYFNAE